MVCVECGTPEDDFDYLCKNCYLKSNPIILSKNRIKISLCKLCLTPVNVRGNWEKQQQIEDKLNQLSNTIKSFIQNKFKLSSGITGIDTEIAEFDDVNAIYEFLPENLSVKILVHANPDPFLPQITESEQIIVFVKYRICIHCQNIGHHTLVLGKLQLRGLERFEKNVENFLEDYYVKIKNENNLSFLPIKIENLKEGIDLSFSSKNPVEYLAQEFNEKFASSNIKTDETISYDHLKSKSKKRMVISVRLPSYAPGDIISILNNLYQVISFSKNRIMLYDFFRNVEVELDMNLINKSIFMYLEFENLKEFQVINIDSFHNTVSLMDLDTFQQYEVEMNQPIESSENQIVLGFLHQKDNEMNKRVYLNYYQKA